MEKINQENSKLLKEGLMWGTILWLIGYVSGFVLYFAVSPSLIGWIIMPIGVIITLLVLFKKIKGDSFQYYLAVAVIWTLIAIVLDYLLLVRLLKPVDGYYKLDVYIYYALNFILPLVVGWMKLRRVKK